MTDFRAETDRIRDTANQVRARADSIDNELSALRGQVGALDGAWSGPAYATFQQLYEQWEQQAQHLHATLADIAERMHRIAEDYERTEHGVVNVVRPS
ncbi:WXG100 family type VII secretion target [Dactylosporangium sp. CA-092794]|uniref:WXG100 family type VII secretion target n=1 Tax=Dactylosporangium sp. CA-092794 TaxID=3239929 RepID=UPI003D900D4E